MSILQFSFISPVYVYYSILCFGKIVWVSAYNQILSESFIIFRGNYKLYFFLILMHVRDGVKAFFHRLRTVDIHTQITTE